MSPYERRPAGAPSESATTALMVADGTDLAIRRHLEAILALLRPRCTRCLRPISAPASIRLGMGPKCRAGEVIR
jgi:hypothetical protein